jgi:hypothetical protein
VGFPGGAPLQLVPVRVSRRGSHSRGPLQGSAVGDLIEVLPLRVSFRRSSCGVSFEAVPLSRSLGVVQWRGKMERVRSWGFRLGFRGRVYPERVPCRGTLDGFSGGFHREGLPNRLAWRGPLGGGPL